MEEAGIAVKDKNLERSYLKCSVNFKIGGTTYTAIFSKSNIIGNKPEFVITESGKGKHNSDFNIEEEKKKSINYKSLYLGIESIFKEASKSIRDNCSKDLKKYPVEATYLNSAAPSPFGIE